MLRSAGAEPQGPGLRWSAEATEENVKQIAVKRPISDSNAHPVPVFEPQEAHNRSRDEAGLRRHQSRRPLGRSRHAAVRPHERSGHI